MVRLESPRRPRPVRWSPGRFHSNPVALAIQPAELHADTWLRPGTTDCSTKDQADHRWRLFASRIWKLDLIDSTH